MNLLAFDLATNTGVAIGRAGEHPVCHSERLGEGQATHGMRFEQAFRMTRRLIEQHKPDIVVIEQPIASGVKGAASRVQLAMGFRAMVAAACSIHRIRFEEYSVMSIRKHFIGTAKLKRDAAKTAVMTRCHQLGWAIANDNEADAAATWEYARAMLAGQSTMPGDLFYDARPKGAK